MPLSPMGEIAYQPAPPTGGIRLQANPPVCNRCWREVYPAEFGVCHRGGRGAPSRPL
jgi:hypothetical protein